MKRICIVTCYRTSNYGSRLQAIALSKAIDKLGYESCFLGLFKARLFTLKHPRMVYARVCKRLTRKKSKNFFTPVPYQMGASRKARMDQFTKDCYRELEINSDADWNKIIKEQMVFVSGSDIIWNPAFGYPGFYFLDFACYADLPCIAYASSVGAFSLPNRYFTAYRKYLNHFQTIGVRENATIEMFSKIVDTPLTKVVDPTLLLSGEEWNVFANKAQYSKKVSDRYIFCYFVMNDQKYWDYAKIVREKTNLQIVTLPMHYLDEKQPFTIIEDGTPYEYIDLIKHAEFVLTDSFHTCVFSLLYNKEFYLLRRERKAEDAKFDEFLNRYGLSDRIIKNRNAFQRKTEINYETANKQLEIDREASMTFLKQALQGCMK